MNEEEKRKKNIKLYPFYRMFSWDLLFYYAIIFLFLTQEKELSISNILIADIFYPISKIIFQLPCILIADWFGKRKSIILGNLFICISLLLLIIGNGLPVLILFNIFLAIGFNLKDMCESSILYDSLNNNSEKNNIFSRIDGRGSAFHYYIDAISSSITGFLFVFNGYAPMICCFIFFCMATFISFKFEECETNKSAKYIFKQEQKFFKEYFVDLRKIFKFIFKSNRLKGLLLFSGIFTSFLTLMTTLRSAVLSNLNVPEIYFGLIVGALQIFAALASKKHLILNNRFKNKTLQILSLLNSFLLILVGFITMFIFDEMFLIPFISLWLIIYAVTKGAFHPLIRRYLNSFSTPSVNTKIYACQNIFDSIARIPILLLAALILTINNLPLAILILGFLLCICFIFLLYYMKPRVGLQPDEYKKSEINYYSTIVK